MEPQKKKTMIFYVTDADRRRIRIAAAHADMSMSAFVVDCVMKQVREMEENTIQRSSEK